MIHTNIKNKEEKGYAILFAVVVVSIISVLGIGLANTAYKELVLSSLANDSQTAFYQSDMGAECALYADNVVGLTRSSLSPWKCGVDSSGNDYSFTISSFGTVGYQLISSLNGASSIPCFEFNVDRTTTPPIATTMKAFGYNSCIKTSAKTVEREFQVTY